MVNLHVTSTVKLGDDYVSKCTCRPEAVSLPLTSEYDAKRWICPFEEAEYVSARNFEMFHRRMAEVFDPSWRSC